MKSIVDTPSGEIFDGDGAACSLNATTTLAMQEDKVPKIPSSIHTTSASYYFLLTIHACMYVLNEICIQQFRIV